jgi:5-bromo-4-chloroindolyl phosphate hydrolysis protein
MLDPKRRRRLRAKSVGLLLFLLSFPLLLKAVFSLWGDDPAQLAASGGSWLLFLAGAWLCRRGLQAEILEGDRPFVARRALRLKTAGGAFVALATASTALFAAHHSLPIAIVFGLVAGIGYFMVYASERQSSARPGRESVDPDAEAAPLLRDAYARLDKIELARQQIVSSEFKQRLGGIVESGERILRLIAEDPRDLRRARKFLTVYLDGAQRITEEYARTHLKGGSVDLEHNFRTLLVDMQNACDEQYAKLLQNDVSDLEIQIEVLSTRLRREGVI